MAILIDLDKHGTPGWLTPLGRVDRDAIRKRVKARYAKDAGFDPSQPRDDYGRWTKSGEAKAFEKTLPGIRDRIEKVAKQMNFPPERIFVSKGKMQAELNGEIFESAAVAINSPEEVIWTEVAERYQEGDIVLFEHAMMKEPNIEGVIAHEIQHQRFQTIFDKASEEMRAVAKKYGRGTIFDPDTGLIVSIHKDEMPMATKLDQAGLYSNAGMNLLAASDGCTDYSAMHWKEFDTTPDLKTFLTAVHETLAEMARVSLSSGSKVIEDAPRWWKRLYYLVDDEYKKIRSVKDAGFDRDQPRDKEGQWTETGSPGKVLKLGNKTRTGETHKAQGDALKFTLGLYETLQSNPLHDQEIYKDFDGVLAFFEFGKPIEPNLVNFKHIRTYPKRKGGGTKALQWLMEEARKADVGLRLDVDRTSDTPHRVLYKLYSKLGFVGENGPKDKESMVWWPEK